MDTKGLLDNREFQFWLLHIGGWTAWGLTMLFQMVYQGIYERYGFYLPVVTIVVIVLSLSLRYIYRGTWLWPMWARLGVVAISTLCLAMLWWVIRTKLYYVMVDPLKAHYMPTLTDISLYFDSSFAVAFTMMLCWSAGYFSIKYYQQMVAARQRALKADAMAQSAQLKMLRYQLNPHFLFNTLNAISTLVLLKENDTANTMVTRLSSFLRYSLDSEPMARVTLAQEVDALSLYLDIEKVRFEERLRFDVTMCADAQNGLVPSLLLQPIVENSIKYAISANEQGGTIRVDAKVLDDKLFIELSDDGPGLPEGYETRVRSSGVGLRNTRDRLSELYGKEQSFEVKNRDEGGVQINICIPYQTE